jgi:hypothetical protein
VRVRLAKDGNVGMKVLTECLVLMLLVAELRGEKGGAQVMAGQSRGGETAFPKPKRHLSVLFLYFDIKTFLDQGS